MNLDLKHWLSILEVNSEYVNWKSVCESANDSCSSTCCKFDIQKYSLCRLKGTQIDSVKDNIYGNFML